MMTRRQNTLLYALLLSAAAHGVLFGYQFLFSSHAASQPDESYAVDVWLEQKRDAREAQESHAPPHAAVAKPVIVAAAEMSSDVVESHDAPLQVIAADNAARSPGSNSPTSEDGTRFLSLLHQAIDSRKHYPVLARRQQREGTVRLQFVMRPDGVVSDIAVVESSRFELLDNAAKQAVAAISPFVLAANYISESRSFDVNIEFRLN
jgi:protein TonB